MFSAKNSEVSVRDKLMNKGFTLIEMLIVVSVISIMMAALAISVSGARERARVVKAEVELREIVNAIRTYEEAHYEDANPLPFSTEDADSLEVSLANMGALLDPKNNSEGVVYLNARLNANDQFLDPWGRPYRVRIIRQQDNEKMDETFVTGVFVPNLARYVD